ncbi:riboflavin synthase [Salirhabdus sp. Marseille-P4669]|uniref:riboflavin synthase n=1 Tax=Salirhabdus sp. Marseille-P4669 TaxID=2042310 RepID=UPI000C7BA270|nr:riboflavin synthase [Salirhabdus sp. Marseille-P4669]
MFTGIIEELGVVKTINKAEKAIVMEIEAKEIVKDVGLGDSISVNGVCLTVTKYNDKSFLVDVMPETVNATSLEQLKVGSKVNLERAMAANGRFGGHFVSGHVDAIGTIIKKEPLANAVYYTIKVPKEYAPYFMLKGSVAIDGTSLTIFGVDEQTITISLIPHTTSHTVLGDKNEGDIVNIECDMLAKYVANILAKGEKDSAINKQFLKENGFL